MTADHDPSAMRRRPQHGRLLLVPAVLLVIMASVAMAQAPLQEGKELGSNVGTDRPRSVLGFSAGLDWTIFKARFNVFASGADCGQYESATVRSRGAIDLFAETTFKPIAPLQLVGHLLFRRYSAMFTSPPQSVESANPDNTIVTVTKQYGYRTDITGVGISAGLLWEFVPGIRAELAPGITSLFTGAQQQTEVILDPPGAQFVASSDGIRNINDPFFVLFYPLVTDINLALSGRFPMGDRLSLQPRLAGTIHLTPFARNATWNGVSVAAMLGLSWDFSHREEEKPVIAMPVEPVDPVAPPPPVHPETKPFLAAKISARGIDEQGNEYDNPVIEIEEAPWIESVPVIPYVFFDSLSAAIPERYARLADHRAAARFSTDSLLQITPIDIHWQLLNVIGQRMLARPNVIMTITGTTSGDEMAPPDSLLALSRALAVRAYFRDVWGIDTARIRLATANRISQAPPDQIREGNQESRRAELTFTDERLSNPVIVRRLAKIASPPAVRFYPEILADTAVTQWTISVFQGNRELLRFDGNSDPESLMQRRMWALTDLRVNRDFTSVGYRLDVRDITGQTTSAEGAFKVTERTKVRPDSVVGNLELQEYSLVGFDYNSSALLPRHLTQLEALARTLTAGSEVRIAGYTDRLGDPERNRQLSLQRAEVVREALTKLKSRGGSNGGVSITVQGLGQRDQMFDNDLPEGRILSRRVRIMASKSTAP